MPLAKLPDNVAHALEQFFSSSHGEKSSTDPGTFADVTAEQTLASWNNELQNIYIAGVSIETLHNHRSFDNKLELANFLLQHLLYLLPEDKREAFLNPCFKQLCFCPLVAEKTPLGLLSAKPVSAHPVERAFHLYPLKDGVGIAINFFVKELDKRCVRYAKLPVHLDERLLALGGYEIDFAPRLAPDETMVHRLANGVSDATSRAGRAAPVKVTELRNVAQALWHGGLRSLTKPLAQNDPSLSLARDELKDLATSVEASSAEIKHMLSAMACTVIDGAMAMLNNLLSPLEKSSAELYCWSERLASDFNELGNYDLAQLLTQLELAKEQKLIWAREELLILAEQKGALENEHSAITQRLEQLQHNWSALTLSDRGQQLAAKKTMQTQLEEAKKTLSSHLAALTCLSSTRYNISKIQHDFTVAKQAIETSIEEKHRCEQAYTEKQQYLASAIEKSQGYIEKSQRLGAHLANVDIHQLPTQQQLMQCQNELIELQEKITAVQQSLHRETTAAKLAKKQTNIARYCSKVAELKKALELNKTRYIKNLAFTEQASITSNQCPLKPLIATAAKAIVPFLQANKKVVGGLSGFAERLLRLKKNLSAHFAVFKALTHSPSLSDKPITPCSQLLFKSHQANWKIIDSLTDKGRSMSKASQAQGTLAYQHKETNYQSLTQHYFYALEKVHYLFNNYIHPRGGWFLSLHWNRSKLNKQHAIALMKKLSAPELSKEAALSIINDELSLRSLDSDVNHQGSYFRRLIAAQHWLNNERKADDKFNLPTNISV